MKTISSKNNTYIKFIRSLHNKKGRDQSRKFYIEGIHQVGEALSNNFPLESIIYSPGLLKSSFGKSITENGHKKGVEIIQVTPEVFKSISLKEGPQGISAVGIQKWVDLSSLAKLDGVWIAIENIQDPGNLGSILRSLDGINGKGIILLGDSTDPYHPTAVRASTGTIFRILVVRSDVKDIDIWRSTNGAIFIGTICETAKSYRHVEYPENMVLFMGSEQKGLSKEARNLCDELVTIHMSGSIDSLNLACAASIVLFEIHDQKVKND